MSLSISTVRKLASAVSLTATGNQAGVDISDLTGKCILVLNAGQPTSGVTLDVKLQHSTDNGATDAFADVSPAVAFTQVTNAGGASLQQIIMDVDGFKKYVRVSDTVAGSGSVARSVEIVGKVA